LRRTIGVRPIACVMSSNESIMGTSYYGARSRKSSSRMTWGDVVALEPFFASGVVAPPRHRPPWAANLLSLAAYLTWSLMANRINLAAIRLEDFRDLAP